MQNKIIVLIKDGQWLELENCFVIGAVEYPDKVVYHKYWFSNCENATRVEMLNKAEKYVQEIKKDPN
jgi:hypothetical protein